MLEMVLSTRRSNWFRRYVEHQAEREVVAVRLLMWLSERMQGERGANLAEYALLVLLIAIVAIVAVVLAGTEVSEQYSYIASSIDV